MRAFPVVRHPVAVVVRHRNGRNGVEQQLVVEGEAVAAVEHSADREVGAGTIAVAAHGRAVFILIRIAPVDGPALVGRELEFNAALVGEGGVVTPDMIRYQAHVGRAGVPSIECAGHGNDVVAGGAGVPNPRVRTALVFLEIVVSVAIAIQIGVGRVVGIEPVGVFPRIRKTVPIAVRRGSRLDPVAARQIVEGEPVAAVERAGDDDIVGIPIRHPAERHVGGQLVVLAPVRGPGAVGGELELDAGLVCQHQIALPLAIPDPAQRMRRRVPSVEGRGDSDGGVAGRRAVADLRMEPRLVFLAVGVVVAVGVAGGVRGIAGVQAICVFPGIGHPVSVAVGAAGGDPEARVAVEAEGVVVVPPPGFHLLFHLGQGAAEGRLVADDLAEEIIAHGGVHALGIRGGPGAVVVPRDVARRDGGDAAVAEHGIADVEIVRRVAARAGDHEHGCRAPVVQQGTMLRLEQRASGIDDRAS